MKVESFFVDALTAALDLGIATPEDVLRHLTPDVLARVLPRPLWARLLTACLGAPRVDARLVVDTIGVPNLCAHAPAPLVWACIAELATRALGGAVEARPAAAPAQAAAANGRSGPLVAPPPEASPPPAPAPATPAAVRGPSIPAPAAIADLADELEPDGRAASRPRAPASQRFRPSNTSAGRLGTRDTRRPQAQATPPRDPPAPPVRDTRRSLTEATEAETEVSFSNDGGGDWRESLAVEDSQLVDWQAAEETQAGDEPRKR